MRATGAMDGMASRRAASVSVVVSSRRRFVRTRSNDAGGGGRGGRARGTRHDSAGDGGRSKRFVIRSPRACSAVGTAVSTTSATGDGVERATGETSVSSKRTSERRGRESDARDGTGRARARRRGGRARPPRVSRRTVKVKRPRRDRRSARARRRVSARRSSDDETRRRRLSGPFHTKTVLRSVERGRDQMLKPSDG